MNFHPLQTVLMAGMAFLAVFAQAGWLAPARIIGAQFDLLPGLMVYASLKASSTTVSLVAVAGGLLLDTLSANPLGISIVPLLVVGVVTHRFRHLILREEAYAQSILGLAASAGVPLITVLLLVTLGHQPVLGLGSLWQWLVMSVVGALWTPLCFACFDRLLRGLSYTPLDRGGFRADREIERGRY